MSNSDHIRHGDPRAGGSTRSESTANGTADLSNSLADGTLTDSIAAVEAAWGKVANNLGQDPVYVIAATHGKRAVDNLAQFKSHIKVHEMDAKVQAFEESILFFAEAFTKHGPGSREVSPLFSRAATPSLASSSSSSGTSSSGSRVASPRSCSPSPAGYTDLPSLVRCVTNRLALITAEGATYEDEEITGIPEPMIDWRMGALAEAHIRGVAGRDRRR
ncbi:hypothetical protein DICSQDRAFT_174647 [Dichomitus squalens LYAD-421 SS1]|uniref:Uncharacterized protein n=1 Tax=Dichomitus squalens (strain LYAD-421) TaxID=732165 RepID=R7SKN5_DICSQ|nr:uncharacterized protein DICSQDRAFT_174647 [Dichomitus squalens LYAD-421 SS1]EJF56696.1 hypothetical protein DICSQDRAFT_174647 [Dichomitus squalens LYAD-421 SS1]